jgi:hypothetical protein
MSKPSYQELEKELIALKKNATRSSKELPYREFFNHMADMVFVIELIYDNNSQPIDFYIRALNISVENFLAKLRNNY